MSNKIILIINWLFGSTFTVWIGMLMTEVSSGIRFEYWLKIGTGLAVFFLACFKVYDWIEKKCRKYRRLKKK